MVGKLSEPDFTVYSGNSEGLHQVKIELCIYFLNAIQQNSVQACEQ